MDRPSTHELLEAVAEFLERELLPTVADARLRFQTLVALNALAIARRDLALGEALEAEERQALAALLGQEGSREELLGELCRRIRKGEAPEGTRSFLLAHVRRKLRLASPKYLDRYR